MLRGLPYVVVTIALATTVIAACSGGTTDGPKSTGDTLRAVASNELRTPADFAGIADVAERSRALFLEATRVLQHPRCVNCHPDGDIPHQGMALALHDPPVVRGPDDHGVVGMM